MIYASGSVIINLNPNQLLELLIKFLSSNEQGSYMKECQILENHYDGFTRHITIKGEDLCKERVFILKDQNKIVIRLEDNPLIIGETIYQIVCSDMPELHDKRVTLSLVIANRMRPGIIEAPQMNKQIIADDLLENILLLAQNI